MAAIWFETALLPDGWARGVRVVCSGARITSVRTGMAAEQDDERACVGVAGLHNLHSHSFQRAIAGRAEKRVGQCDDFWSWREAMYGLVAALTPEDVAAIAAMAFAEMLEGGFTRVGEFHYLHHDSGGRPYAQPALMAAAIAAASEEAGVALTLLPVFYAHSGFGGAPPSQRQRRFVCSVDGFAKLHQDCASILHGVDGAVLGFAPHSLRAVTPDELDDLLKLAPTGPIHIHIAEQTGEVEGCLAWSGKRPIEWLLDNAAVSERWCLVHATHATSPEVQGIAATAAVVGLCPVTEANLGDGLFPARALLDAGGRFGIGSDSNVRIDAAEELRSLEYGQRLWERRRNVLAQGQHSTGASLFGAASVGGAQALGVEMPAIAAGQPADLLALAASEPGIEGDEVLDHWIFGRGRVDAVWSAGRQVVRNGRHVHRSGIEERYRQALIRLRSR